MDQPDAGAHRRGQQAKQFLEGEGLRPGGVANGVLPPRTGRHRLGRQVFGVDGLKLVVAIPEDGENRKTPQGPGHVVQQQVALTEDQGGPDDGLRDTHTHQDFLYLPLAPEVGQPGLGRGVGYGEMYYPAHASFRSRFKQ